MAVFIPACATTQQNGGSSATTPVLQIRAVQEEFSAGMERTELSGTEVFIASEDVVNDSHVEYVTVTRTPTGVVLRVQLTEEGAARLGQMTRTQVGNRMGLLVESRLLSAPRVIAELNPAPRALDVGIQLPDNEVDSAVRALQTRFDEIPGYNGSTTFDYGGSSRR